MDLKRRLLAIVFCLCASMAPAQPVAEPPTPTPQAQGAGTAPSAGGEAIIIGPSGETPETDPVPSKGDVAVPTRPLPEERPVAKVDGEPGEEEAPAPSIAAAADDWVTQTDTSPFDIGMPFEQQPDGAFRYTYPIDVPALRGLEPALTLHYASLNKPADLLNFIGDGWRLGGLSRIVRTSPTGGTPTYDNDLDIMQLDGEELLACANFAGDYPAAYRADAASASCSSGGNYVTTHDNYLKIVQDGERGDRLAKYYIYRTDGTRLMYETLAGINGNQIGENNGWRGPAYNRAWLLTEIRDTQANPNIVNISYDIDATDNDSQVYGWDYRPKEISYAGYKIALAYVKSDGIFTSERVALSGHRSKGVYALNKITLSRNDSTYRIYTLDRQAQNGRDVITNIIKRSASLEALSEESFTYADFPNPDSGGVGQYHLLTQVTNALGGTTSVSYGLSTNSAFVTNDRIRGVRRLVQAIEADDGRGSSLSASFKYDNSYYDELRERSLGFAKVTATLPKIQSETSSPYIVGEYYNSDYARNGTPYRRSHYVDGALARRVTNTYATQWAGNGPWRAQLSGVRHEGWDGNDTFQVTTTFQRNEFGNPVQVHSLGYTKSNGSINLDATDDLTTYFSYSVDRASYIVGKPTYVRHIASDTIDDDPAKRLQAHRFQVRHARQSDPGGGVGRSW